MAEAHAAGDPIPPGCQLIEVRISELRQLFNAIDPSPFLERDLDPNAEEFIVGWARDLRPDAPWALLVQLDRAAGRADEADVLRDAIHEDFTRRAVAANRQLRTLFRQGRVSLAIAVAFLATSIAAGDVIAKVLGESRIGEVLREGFLIGGWVAMWRPLEIFLYDWWPIRAEERLLRRLGAIRVRVEYKKTGQNDAWRSDWPAVPPSAAGKVGAVAQGTPA